ncbi:sodium-independent sulfate anion transporter [Episyrphus balteatus]|uniref:sodium-independent sulfate anion transporter n=1 Tax=Episyrphus balteatus TaxID=286459 RepID=UPI002486A1DB|nr:sodium-independent sulfate anion transporter [Episyrphus balteatus]
MTDSHQTKIPPSITVNGEKGDEEEAREPLQPKFVLGKKKSNNLGARSGKFIRGLLPIFGWICDYDTECAINDFIAGITLGLTIIPESIACALLAGLPAHYGLCSAFLGSFVYLFFGSIDKVIVGPTSLVALVSVQFTMGKPVEFAVVLTFLAGIVQLIMGSLQLGFLFEFISMPVIKAFSTATAILVIESQIKVMLGIKYLAAGFIESIRTLSFRLDESNLGDFLMGLSAIIFLVFFEFLGRVAERPNQPKVKKLIYQYLSFSRNTLIVFITAMVTVVWISQLPAQTSETLSNTTLVVPYALSKTAMSGFPNFTFPAMKIVTPEKTFYFVDILAELNLGIIVIPIVGVLTNISIGKLNPKCRASANQELFTLGLCNIIGSSVQSMPTSGAFTRYAISSACGLKTPMANLYSGMIVLLALGFLSPYLNYIPEATLAAILMCAIVTLIDFNLPLRLWQESRRDFYIWCICFSACVMFGVEVGLLVGIIITVSYLLYLWARPEVTVKIDSIDDMQYISVTPGNGVYFPAINFLRGKILKACIQADFKIPVVINCKMITGLDYTAAQGISRLSTDLCQEGNGSLLILYHMNMNQQKLIDLTENLVFCESKEKIREFLTQESLRNGFINLKAHIRASIDLGYKVDIE